MAEFDGIVIGAGHNGLTLAAYLARAGLRIVVLERNDRIGGGCSTDANILPGFRLNLHANFYMGMSHCPLIEDLELYRYGFSYIEPLVQQAAVFRDGTCITISTRPAPHSRAFPSKMQRLFAHSGTHIVSRCGHYLPACSTMRQCRASSFLSD